MAAGHTQQLYPFLYKCSAIIKPVSQLDLLLHFKGVLPGAGEDPPTIVITAHYDTFGLAPVSHPH